jgi:hypothetical protein
VSFYHIQGLQTSGIKHNFLKNWIMAKRRKALGDVNSASVAELMNLIDTQS